MFAPHVRAEPVHFCLSWTIRQVGDKLPSSGIVWCIMGCMNYYDLKRNPTATYWNTKYNDLLKLYQKQLVKEVLNQEYINEVENELWISKDKNKKKLI